MSAASSRWARAGFQAGAVVLAVLATALLLLLAGAPPLKALGQIAAGAFGSLNSFSDVLVVWAPLLLVTAGLLVTFEAGLWNIGIEGQITLGAVFTTWALRALQDCALPPVLIVFVAVLAGILGGVLWAGLAGGLKLYGGVNEIFGGLGLNYVATALTLWLIFGPWKRPGVGSMSGTVPFPEALWLWQWPGLRLSPAALALGLLAIVLVCLLLNDTYFGLRLKATGKNIRAAFRLGVPTARHLMLSFAVCGGLGGLAGALQVTAVYHRLIPSISSGYGFLGLLIALLAGLRAAWAAPVALFFAALNIGSIQLPIVLQLDSSLSGVLQGLLVLCVLLVEGARRRLAATREKEGPA